MRDPSLRGLRSDPSMRFPRPDKRDPVDRAEAAKSYYRRNADKVNTRVGRWREENPRKRVAHMAVKRALYSGELIKLANCQRCPRKKIDAHHDDYDRQLDIIWLCRSCHRLRHRQLKLEGRDPD